MAGSDLKIQITGTLDSSATITEINRILTQIESKINKINIGIQVNDQANSALNNLNQQISNLNRSAATVSNSVQNVSSQMNNVGNSARQAATHTLTLGSAIKQAFAGFSLWSLTAQLVYTPVRAFDDMIQRLVQIDTQMTDINRILGGMSNFQLNNLLQTAIDESDQLKNKLTDTLSIMSEFATMGYKSDDLGNLSKVAEILTNVSGLDAKGAVDSLVSSMVNFNIQTKDAMSIADKFTHIDNNFAVTTLDLAQGIQKAGAAAKTFGVDIDSLNGYITAIAQSTRESGDVIGNGLKTIFSRMTTAKSSIKALQDVGVAVTDLQGNVRPLTDIIADLAGKWNSLSDNQKQSLAVQEAGRFQITRFVALMNNYNVAVQATKTSIDSQGSAIRAQSVYADSLQARINRLDTAFNKLTLSMGKAFLTNGIIDTVESLNGLATGASKVIDKVGALGIIMGILGLVTTGVSDKFRAFSTAMIFGTTKLTEEQLALTGLTEGMTRAEVATAGFTVSLRALGTATVVGLAFTALGFVLEKVINAFADAKKADEEFQQTQQKGIDALTTNKQQTEELIAQYEGLTEAKQKAGQSWSVTDENQYLQTQQKLADIYPQLISYIDTTGQAHLKNKDQIDQETKATEELIKAKQEQLQLEAKSDFNNLTKSTNSLSDQIDSKNAQLIQAVVTGADQQTINKLKIDILDLQKKWADAQQNITDKVMKLAESYNALKIDPSIKKSVEEFMSSFDRKNLNSDELDSYSKQIAKVTDALQQAFQNNDKSGFDSAKSSLIDIAIKMGDTKQQAYALSLSYDDLKKSQDAANSAVFAGKDGMDGIDTSASDLTGTVDGLTSAVNSNTDAFSKNISATQILFGVTSDQLTQAENAIAVVRALADQENLSADQQQLLAQATAILAGMYPQLNGQISENIGWISQQIGMMSALSNVSGSNAEAMIANQNATTKATIEQINQRIAGYQKEIGALNSLMASIESAYQDSGMSGYKTQAYTDAQKKVATLTSEMATAQASRIKAYYSSGVNTGQVKPYDSPSSSSKSGSGSAKSASQIQSDIVNEFKNSIAPYETLVALSEAKLKTLDQTSQKYRDEENHQWKVLTEEASKYRTEIDLLTKKYGVNSDSVQQLSKDYATLQEKIATLNWDYYTSEINQHNDAISKLKDQIDLSQKTMSLYSNDFNVQASERKKQVGLVLQSIAELKAEQSDMQGALSHGFLNAQQTADMTKQLQATNSQLIDMETNLKSLQQEYVTFISDTLSKQKEANIQHLQDQFAALDKQLGELVKKDSSFDFSNFNDSLDTIVNSLDELDGKFASNPLFETNTSGIRSSIEDTKNKILDLANAVDKLTSSTSDSQSGLESIIRSEADQANQIYGKIQQVDKQIQDTTLLYKQQEDSLQNQIDLRQNELTQMQQQYQMQQQINQLNDLTTQRDQVKADKRFEIIGADGTKQLTYDVAKVADLNKQIDDLNKQNAEKAQEQALQDQIDAMKKNLDQTKQIHQANLDQLNLYKNSLQNLYDQLNNDIGNKMNDLKTLQDQQITDTTKNWDDLIAAVQNGTATYSDLMTGWYKSTVADMKTYNSDIANQLAQLKSAFADMQTVTTNMAKLSVPTTPKSYTVQHTDSKGKIISASFKTQAEANLAAKAIKGSQIIPIYHEGGEVGNPSSPLSNLINKVFNVGANEQIVKALKGEWMIPPQKVPNLIANIGNAVNSLFRSPQIVQAGDTITLHNVTIKTENAETFLPDLQRIIKTRKS